MRLTKHLFSLFALILVSCECPYQDELDRAQQRKTTGDVFYADVLWRQGRHHDGQAT